MKEIHCPNCGKVLKKGQGHFVPPSMGEPGFFGCEKVLDLMEALKDSLKGNHSEHLLIIDECSSPNPLKE